MSKSALLLAGLLGSSSVLHIVTPKFFDDMIPAQLPGKPNDWTRGSAAVELAVAGLIAAPRTRRIGALAATAVFIGVFPANLEMAAKAFRQNRSTAEKVSGIVRLPLQVPLVLWAWRVSRAS